MKKSRDLAISQEIAPSERLPKVKPAAEQLQQFSPLLSTTLETLAKQRFSGFSAYHTRLRQFAEHTLVKEFSVLAASPLVQMPGLILMTDYVKQTKELFPALSLGLQLQKSFPWSGVAGQISQLAMVKPLWPSYPPVSESMRKRFQEIAKRRYLLSNFLADYRAGKLGEVDLGPDADAIAPLKRYAVMYALCTELEGAGCQQPGDRLQDFGLTLADVPLEQAWLAEGQTPIKLLLRLRQAKVNKQSHVGDKRASEAALAAAGKLWGEDNQATREDIAKEVLHQFGQSGYRNSAGEAYALQTVMDWIKSAMPISRKKGGRPKIKVRVS